MKTGLIYSREKYFVDEKNQTCVCVLKAKVVIPILKDFLGFCERKHIKTGKTEEIFGCSKVELSISASGKSRCAEDDVFYPTIGKKLALVRAQKKLLKKAQRIYTRVLEYTKESFTDTLERFRDNCESIGNHYSNIESDITKHL